MIAVVGVGPMGAATAWHLARRPREVTLIGAFGSDTAAEVRTAAHGSSDGRALAAPASPLVGATAADPATGRLFCSPRGRPLDVCARPIDTPDGNPSEQVGKHGVP